MGAARRHGGHRGEGPRDVSDHRRPGPAVRRPAGGRGSSSPGRTGEAVEGRRAAPDVSPSWSAAPRARSSADGLETLVTGVSIDSRTCRPGDAFFAIRGATPGRARLRRPCRLRGAACAVTTRIPAGLGAEARFPGRAGRRHDGSAPAAGAGPSPRASPSRWSRSPAPTGRPRRRSWWHGALRPPARAKARGQLQQPVGRAPDAPRARARARGGGARDRHERLRRDRRARPALPADDRRGDTIAPAHLEGVGSIEGVQKAKGELVRGDSPRRRRRAECGRAPGAGPRRAGPRAGDDVRSGRPRRTSGSGDVALVEGGLGFRLAAGRATADVRLPLAGRHNAWHAAAAAAVGLALGVPLDEAAAALALAAPVKGRLVWREAGGVRILDDTYNANPVSVRAALDALREAPGAGRRWAILGDMLELGGADRGGAPRGRGAGWPALPVAGLAAVGPAMRADGGGRARGRLPGGGHLRQPRGRGGARCSPGRARGPRAGEGIAGDADGARGRRAPGAGSAGRARRRGADGPRGLRQVSHRVQRLPVHHVPDGDGARDGADPLPVSRAVDDPEAPRAPDRRDHPRRRAGAPPGQGRARHDGRAPDRGVARRLRAALGQSREPLRVGPAHRDGRARARSASTTTGSSSGRGARSRSARSSCPAGGRVWRSALYLYRFPSDGVTTQLSVPFVKDWVPDLGRPGTSSSPP